MCGRRVAQREHDPLRLELLATGKPYRGPSVDDGHVDRVSRDPLQGDAFARIRLRLAERVGDVLAVETAGQESVGVEGRSPRLRRSRSSRVEPSHRR